MQPVHQNPFDDCELAEALGKLMVAFAWRDEWISKEALGCLKDKLLGLTALDEMARGMLLAYKECPGTEKPINEKFVEIRELAPEMPTQQLIFEALYTLAMADDDRSDPGLVEILRKGFPEIDDACFEACCVEYKHYRRRIKATMAFCDTEAVRELGRILFKHHTQGATPSPIAGRWNKLQLLCVGGLLMAYVGKVDEALDWRELGTVNLFIRNHVHANPDQAAALAEHFMKRDISELELVRACRLFFDMSNAETRRELVDALLAIARADKVFQQPENQAILRIAKLLRTPAVRYAS